MSKYVNPQRKKKTRQVVSNCRASHSTPLFSFFCPSMVLFWFIICSRIPFFVHLLKMHHWRLITVWLWITVCWKLMTVSFTETTITFSAESTQRIFSLFSSLIFVIYSLLQFILLFFSWYHSKHFDYCVRIWEISDSIIDIINSEFVGLIKYAINLNNSTLTCKQSCMFAFSLCHV
jgi:hypothetical protein